MKEVPFHDYCGVSSTNAGRDSHKKQAGKSRSRTEEGNNRVVALHANCHFNLVVMVMV